MIFSFLRRGRINLSVKKNLEIIWNVLGLWPNMNKMFIVSKLDNLLFIVHVPCVLYIQLEAELFACLFDCLQ